MTKAFKISAILLAASTIATILVAVGALPAAGAIRWIDKDFDFGLMKEIAGPKSGTSRFVNLGPDTIVITYVKPSCGCTSATFTENPIAPGDIGVVTYTYDPKMRPGKFEKTVRVELSDNSRHAIKITGNVLGTPESLAILYPVDAGKMRLSTDRFFADEAGSSRAPVYFLTAYSLPLDSITPSFTSQSPAIEIDTAMPTAGPGDILTYSITLDTEKAAQYGPVTFPMTFNADPSDPESIPVAVTLSAFILPNTKTLAIQQGKHHPVCDISPDPLNIGADISDSPVKAQVAVSNHGNGPLKILYLGSESDAVSAPKLPKEIKPGKTANVRIDINPAHIIAGAFRIPLDIITNDPDHPHLQVSITGIKH